MQGTKPPEPLRHGRVSLALHELRSGEGDALLCLHALRGSAADWAEAAASWPGPVYALDFAGHGLSEWVAGEATPRSSSRETPTSPWRTSARAGVAGAGLGAYVALLVAGARPEHVPARAAPPRRGSRRPRRRARSGARAEPRLGAPARRAPPPGERPAFDPFTTRLEREFRPPDYAAAFAARASRLLLLDDGDARPPWWQAAAQAAAAERIAARSAAEALARLAGRAPGRMRPR